MNKVIFLIFLITFFISTNAGGRFLKIESCTTSNKTSILERCELVENNLNIILNFKKPLNQFYVIL